MAKQLSQYTGLSEDYLMKADLRVDLSQFMAELQRSHGEVTGRLIHGFRARSRTCWPRAPGATRSRTRSAGAFTAATNSYLRDELKFSTEDRYKMSGGVQWDWNRQGSRGWLTATYVGTDLVQALVTNPALKVEIENGYYDLATPFFATEYTVDHLAGLPAKLRGNIAEKYYDAGHMMYLHTPDLAKLKRNIAAFIGGTSRTGAVATTSP